MLVVSTVGIPAYPVGLGLAFSHSYDRVADPLSIHWLLFLPDACVLTLLSVPKHCTVSGTMPRISFLSFFLTPIWIGVFCQNGFLGIVTLVFFFVCVIRSLSMFLHRSSFFFVLITLKIVSVSLHHFRFRRPLTEIVKLD